MKNTKLQICNAIIQPGELANLALPLPEQYSCAPLYMPIKVAHGVEKGPCLVIFSGIKGTEFNGLEIANRIIKSMNPSKMRGTVIAIPVMNIYGLTHYPVTLPTTNDNLEKCFPGDDEGSYGERIAHVFTQEILKKADYCIELQTGGLNHNILPQVYCNFENTKAKALAKIFQSPVVTNVSLEGNHLRQTTELLKIPLLVYQAGEAKRFDENAIHVGVEGIKNVMRSIDILEKEPIQEVTPIFSQDAEWLTSHKGGILHSHVTLGQTIEENDTIGEINDPFGVELIEIIKAPQKGVVVGINMSPLVHEGLPIFKIASFLDYDKAETTLEAWDKAHGPTA